MQMHLSGSPSNRASPLIGDASFWINLFATGQSEILLNVFGEFPRITDAALGELGRGRSKGRRAAELMNTLVRAGGVKVEHCAAEDEQDFLNLTVGPAAKTLDDGEAATLVCASRLGGTAIIDERKATALAEIVFPSLQVISTVELIIEAGKISKLDGDFISDAIFNALVDARMRVPDRYLSTVVSLLGAERASKCLSLPTHVRIPTK
ncbi:hypothetical protein [Methylobacterium indicum]|uniref:hypothetical protein n=1 Tax=Methylobacterium indicum TaxID=1775910 RepID=UPI002434BE11|nr:hypothetical protein [Methylobacterium indicum]